jgi:hypothetical protein
MLVSTTNRRQADSFWSIKAWPRPWPALAQSRSTGRPWPPRAACRRPRSSKIGLDRHDLGAELPEVGRSGIDQRLVGDDEDIVTVLGRQRRQLEADAGRGAGDDREFSP